MVDDPAGQLLEQRAIGVDVDCLLVLHRLVATFGQSCSVIKISRRNCLEQSSSLITITFLQLENLIYSVAEQKN